jgi:hypothetical protein
MSAITTVRTDSVFINYLTISADALIEGYRYDAECKRTPTPSHELRYHRMNQFRISIVFSGMCIEAFLYDFAAHNFSDEFVTAHLDGMRFLSKCAAYPKLIFGKDIDRSTAHWSALVTLNRNRNDFVHSKSTAPHSDPEAEAKRIASRQAEHIALPKTALTCFSANPLYATELCRLQQMTDNESFFPPWFSEISAKAYENVQQALAPYGAQSAPPGDA